MSNGNLGKLAESRRKFVPSKFGENQNIWTGLFRIENGKFARAPEELNLIFAVNQASDGVAYKKCRVAILVHEGICADVFVYITFSAIKCLC